LPAALESESLQIPLCGLVQRGIFRVPEYSELPIRTDAWIR